MAASTTRVQQGGTHCEVSIGAAALGDGLPNLVHQVVLVVRGRVGGRVKGFLVKLDRHGGSIEGGGGDDDSGMQRGA